MLQPTETAVADDSLVAVAGASGAAPGGASAPRVWTGRGTGEAEFAIGPTSDGASPQKSETAPRDSLAGPARSNDPVFATSPPRSGNTGPGLPSLPDLPSQPNVPQAPGAPGGPGTPETPHVPDGPNAPPSSASDSGHLQPVLDEPTVTYFAHAPRGDCPIDPVLVFPASVPGDRRCQLPLNATRPDSGLPGLVPRLGSEVDTGQSPPLQLHRAWMRLEPAFAARAAITGLHADVYVVHPAAEVRCAPLRPGAAFVQVEVRLLPEGDAGETSDGMLVGRGAADACPGPVGSVRHVRVALSLERPVVVLPGQKLQVIVSAGPEAALWALAYDAAAMPTSVTVHAA